MSSTLALQQSSSRTAYDCAAVRAAIFASTGCASFDYLAAEMVSGPTASARVKIGASRQNFAASDLTQEVVSTISPGVDVFLFARQMLADELVRTALLTSPDIQVVILGAGLDTSGLRIGAERHAVGEVPGTFFEVDLPASQAEKRQHLARLVESEGRLSDDHIVYVPCAFGDNELATGLLDAGFDSSRTSIWIWSGVIHYLSESDVCSTLAEIKQLSETGSTLFFDYILLEAYEHPEQYGFAKTKARFDAYGEVMSFGFRQGGNDVRRFLAARNINVICNYTQLDMVSLFEDKTGCTTLSDGTPWANLCVALL